MLFLTITFKAGDAGGNTTALGIMGGVVPGAGPNRQTEVDTTVFRSRKAASDGLGRTKGNGQNTLDDMSRIVAMSGSTLPQVSNNGGYISATYHIVTTVCKALIYFMLLRKLTQSLGWGWTRASHC